MKEIAKLSLAKVTAETADPRAGAAMDGVRKSLGFVPNMYANMANSPSALESYLSGYHAFRAESDFAPAEQEVVFLTISRENGCEYCMAAHSMVGEKMSGVSAPVLKALRAGESLPDVKLQGLFEFTRIMVTSRGKPTPAELQAFLAAGYSEKSSARHRPGDRREDHWQFCEPRLSYGGRSCVRRLPLGCAQGGVTKSDASTRVEGRATGTAFDTRFSSGSFGYLSASVGLPRQWKVPGSHFQRPNKTCETFLACSVPSWLLRRATCQHG